LGCKTYEDIEKHLEKEQRNSKKESKNNNILSNNIDNSGLNQNQNDNFYSKGLKLYKSHNESIKTYKENNSSLIEEERIFIRDHQLDSKSYKEMKKLYFSDVLEKSK
jgi:hypothetical protein